MKESFPINLNNVAVIPEFIANRFEKTIKC